jgi:hypothetical protein
MLEIGRKSYRARWRHGTAPLPWLLIRPEDRNSGQTSGKVYGTEERRSFIVPPLDNSPSSCVVWAGRDVAQSGRALRSGRRGRWFKSSRPDQTFE